MKRVPDISLILPCYNESGLFLQSVARIRSVLETSRYTWEVIFVDDGSTDDTQKLIAAYCRKNTQFCALYHVKNMGRGKTVTDGILKAQGRVAGYIDIDCEVDPVYIPAMAHLILAHYSDVVIGKRYYRTSPKAILRELLSRGYQRLADMMVGTGRMDTETGYKFFSRKKILPVIKKTRYTGWFWDTEIMVYARRAKLRINEYPVLFLRRFDKKSSVNIVSDTWDYLVNLYTFRKRLELRLVQVKQNHTAIRP